MISETGDKTTVSKGIKPYAELDVNLTYQNFGSTWLCILRGTTENIDLVFNGLFNLRGTNGDYQFHDHSQTCAIFWSDRKGLRRFFFNRFFIPRAAGNGTNQGDLIRRAMKYAHQQIALLKATGHEFFMNFKRDIEPVLYSMGRISAENPDSDFKDSVMSYAFAARD